MAPTAKKIAWRSSNEKQCQSQNVKPPNITKFISDVIQSNITTNVQTAVALITQMSSFVTLL